MTPPGLARTVFPAMGTEVSVLAPLEAGARHAGIVRDLFARWEEVLSRFRPESELSHLNAHAGETVAVGPLLFEVTATALAAAAATDGIYDPTLLHQLVRVGYDRTFADLPVDRPGSAASAAPGGSWRTIRLDHDTRTITLPEDVALDFGGIAKGMAVDAAISALREAGAACAAVEAGGDLAVHGLPPDQPAWYVAVRGTLGRETVALSHGALATSSVERRHWRQDGRLRHHLLDPRTGEPVENGLWSVTVAAARCQQADVAAKSAFVLGPDAGAAFLIERGLAGLMNFADGRQRRVGAWPEAPEVDTS